MSESVESSHGAISGSSRAWKQHSKTLAQAAHSQEQLQLNDTTEDNNILSTANPGTTNDASPISCLSNVCLKCYQDLHDALAKSTDNEATDAGFDRNSSLTEISDASSRFKAWGGNIAAFQRGHLKSSLDARLKEAKEIRERILRILRDHKQSLETATLIVSGSIPNERWQLGALSDSDDDEVSDAGEAGPETSELEELFTAIKAANGNLLKLSLVIRTSPTRDDYLKAASRYSLDSIWDIGHVREKYGSAKRSTDWLVERMGKAITRRRQYLKYREEHHGKLSRDWEEGAKDPSPDEQKTLALTKATTFVEAKVLIEKDDSDEKGSFGSQTSYEPTVVGENIHKLTPPAPPKFAFEGVPFEFGEPFRCPYCYTEQVVKNKTAWKKHVFRDLKPYVCTFKECDLKLFRSRNEWWMHELHNHRREWICATCYAPFNSKSTFIGHLKSSHNTTISGSQLDGLVLKSEEPVNKIPASACMLCDEWEANLLDPKQDAKRAFLNDGAKVEPCGTLAHFRRHLGRHMEQLALFALPLAEGDAMEDDSAGNADDAASVQSAASELEPNDTTVQLDLEKFEAEFLRRFSPIMTYVEMEVILQTVTPRPDLVQNILDVFKTGSAENLKELGDQLLKVHAAVSKSSNANPDSETVASEINSTDDLPQTTPPQSSLQEQTRLEAGIEAEERGQRIVGARYREHLASMEPSPNGGEFISYFNMLTVRRKEIYIQKIQQIIERAAYYYRTRPHPSEFLAADEEVKHGIDEDYATALSRYPKVLEATSKPQDSKIHVSEPKGKGKEVEVVFENIAAAKQVSTSINEPAIPRKPPIGGTSCKHGLLERAVGRDGPSSGRLAEGDSISTAITRKRDLQNRKMASNSNVLYENLTTLK